VNIAADRPAKLVDLKSRRVITNAECEAQG
jgi:hypothetical protein